MATAESLTKTVTINGSRYYDLGAHKLPSVTTILGKMTDKSGLFEWKRKVGFDEAARISKFAANRGTIMHQMIEFYLLSEGKVKSDRLFDAQKQIVAFKNRDGYSGDELRIGRALFFNFYNELHLDKIAEVVSIEETLWSLLEGGFAGRVDVIYKTVDNRLLILDFKSSKKPKKLEWVEGYLMQVAAYFIAYWERSGIKPCGGEIWISCETGEVQIIEMDIEMIKTYGAKFLKLVKGFHEKYGDI